MKKLLAITLTLTLVVGLFSLTSRASRADAESGMDETTAVDDMEEPVEKEYDYEDSEMEETDQEEIEGVDQETLQEQDKQSDDNSIEEIEEPDMQEPEKSDEEYYIYDRTWEDDEFVYELESEDPSDIDTRLVLTKTCKQCGLCDFDVITQQQVLQRFDIDLHK